MLEVLLDAQAARYTQPRSTVQPSSSVPAKRGRVSVRPAAKVAAPTAKFSKMPNGADMAMNAENLPPLPPLDPDLAHLPYAENKVACQHGLRRTRQNS